MPGNAPYAGAWMSPKNRTRNRHPLEVQKCSLRALRQVYYNGHTIWIILIHTWLLLGPSWSCNVQEGRDGGTWWCLKLLISWGETCTCAWLGPAWHKFVLGLNWNLNARGTMMQVDSIYSRWRPGKHHDTLPTGTGRLEDASELRVAGSNIIEFYILVALTSRTQINRSSTSCFITLHNFWNFQTELELFPLANYSIILQLSSMSIITIR